MTEARRVDLGARVTSSAVWLIARREIATRWQQKGFRIGLAVALVIVALAAAAPRVFAGGGGPTTYDVAVTGSAPAGFDRALQASAQAQRTTIRVHQTPSAAGARDRVSSGDWDAAVTDNGLVVGKADSAVVAVVQAAYRSATELDRLGRAGVSDTQARQALDVTPLPVTSTQSGQSSQRQAIATVTVLFLFGQLIAFCTWMGMGVVEEKTSRVVELLLATVRPLQMLTGKLIGIGLLATAQAVVIGGVALVVAVGTGSLDLPASVYGAIAVSVLWFVLGFAFFAALSAALASLVSRQEEVSSVMTPVSMLLLLTYFGGFAAASSPDSTAARILSVVPPFSVISMPARLARGGVPLLDSLSAAVLMIATTVVVLAGAAKIYRAAVLHTGGRLTVRKAWRSEAAAELV